MSHNPNSQNNQSLNDEMAAEESMAHIEYWNRTFDYFKRDHTEEEAARLADIEIRGWHRGFASGCKHKAEQLSNGSVSFDEASAANEGIEQMKLGVAVDSAYIRASRNQFKKLAPIINAQAERLKTAEAERDFYFNALKRIWTESIDTSTDGGMNFVRDTIHPPFKGVLK